MADVKPTFPPLEILSSLVKIRLANKEEIASLNGEIGDRQSNLYDHYEDFTPKTARLFLSLAELLHKNELKAREEARATQVAMDAFLAYADKFGHVADIADLARKAAQDTKPAEAPAPSPALTPDEAQAAFEATADKAPTPAQVDAKAERKAKGKAKDSVDSFREELRGTIEKGDSHIREVATEPKPSPMPDIPETLDRRTEKPEPAEKPKKAAFGSFRMVT